MIGIISWVLVYSAQADPWHLLPHYFPPAQVSGAVCELPWHKKLSFVSSDSFLLLWSVMGISKEPISSTFCLKACASFQITTNVIWDFCTFTMICMHLCIAFTHLHTIIWNTHSFLLTSFIHMPSKTPHFIIKASLLGPLTSERLSFHHLQNGGCKHETHLRCVKTPAFWEWYARFVSRRKLQR